MSLTTRSDVGRVGCPRWPGWRGQMSWQGGDRRQRVRVDTTADIATNSSSKLLTLQTLKVTAMEVPCMPWKSSFHIVSSFTAYSRILQICTIYTPFVPSDVFLGGFFFGECIFVVCPLGCSVSPSPASDCPTADI